MLSALCRPRATNAYHSADGAPQPPAPVVPIIRSLSAVRVDYGRRGPRPRRHLAVIAAEGRCLHKALPVAGRCQGRSTWIAQADRERIRHEGAGG